MRTRTSSSRGPSRSRDSMLSGTPGPRQTAAEIFMSLVLISERIRRRLVANRHPLPARVLVEVRGTANGTAGTGDAGATERIADIVVHGLIVDVHHPRIEF